jgi:hypothetical protein
MMADKKRRTMTIYCYWHKPNVVLAAQVAIAPTFPVNQLTIGSIISGSLAQCRTGMTVLVGTALGKGDLGRVRCKGQTGFGAILVAWASQGRHDGELDPVVNSYITVLDEYRIWAKTPRILDDGTVYMDNDVLPDGHIVTPDPVSNCGPSEAGTIDPASRKLRISHYGGRSWQWIDNNNVQDITAGKFAWNTGGGTVVSGATNQDTVVVDYPPGIYTIFLTVTDDRGYTHTSHKLLYVRDPANDQCLAHQITSHQASGRGQTMDIRFFNRLDPDVYRDGSMVIVWEEDGVNPLAPMFCGWHVGEKSGMTQSRTANLGDSVFHFVDVTGKLALLPGFSQELGYNATFPVHWNETPFNNLLFYLTFLLYWQSTALECCDLAYDDYLPQLHFPRLESEAGNLYDQVNSMANMMTPDFYFTCNHYGQMMLVPDPSIVLLGDRNAHVIFYGTLDDTMWTDIQYEGHRDPRCCELMSGALVSKDVFIFDDNGNEVIDTVWCIAPGVTRGQGADHVQNTKKLAIGQFDFNHCEGNRYAHLNSPWGDIVIRCPWSYTNLYGIDPGAMGRVVINFSDPNFYPPRPPHDTGFNGLVKTADYQYDYQRTGLLRTVQYTVEVETSGQPAETWFRPAGTPQ